jgi:excinuclease ABC subunit C
MYKNIPAPLRKQLDSAPKNPGVYMFRNEKHEVIYVGKAVNLANRSRSYFANFKRLDPRIQTMVKEACDIDYLVVDNEVEALLLESNLIKKYVPYYNRVGKDDKSYLWIKIFSQMDFPRVTTVREKQNDGSDYFGPYPNVMPVRRMLKYLRKIFKYRTSTRTVEVRKNKQGKNYVYTSDPSPCFYYHLGLCSGACMGKQSKSEYRKQINDLKKFLRSEHQDLKKKYKKQMQNFAQNKQYEKAAEMRDKLFDLEYITKYSLIDESIDDITLKQRQISTNQQGIIELVKKLKIPKLHVNKQTVKRFRIECYDISNIQGTNATSSMVVSVGGSLQNNQYRKFKIRSKQSPDDFLMLQETLQRRLKYLIKVLKTKRSKNQDRSFLSRPDLIVIDGGKGQLSSVLKILHSFEKNYDIKIPVIGLAKKNEEIFVPEYAEGNENTKINFRLVKINRRSPSLKVIQQLRDEAHRFGLGYHRLLRSKSMVYSELDLIPGVGKVTKQSLIKAFGSVQGIKKAKLQDIQTVVKNKKTAFTLKKLLV